jgi:hypothetical protein
MRRLLSALEFSSFTRAAPLAVAGCGIAVLLVLQGWRLSLKARAQRASSQNEALAERLDESSQALGDAAALRDDRDRKLARFRRGLPRLAEDSRRVYESGLQLQEEKRLLEKQLEIMTTYLLVDEAAGQVHLMRGEQALETYPTGFGAPRVLGGAKSASPSDTVVSKERFAHPERPKAEQTAGQLQWEPPQVGTSARVNALGEFVVFTRGGLILHGPPAKEAEHSLYPHACLELSLPIARRLYAASNIGTRIVLKRAAVAHKGKR